MYLSMEVHLWLGAVCVWQNNFNSRSTYYFSSITWQLFSLMCLKKNYKEKQQILLI